MSLENFKKFVRTKPNLVDYVRKGEMSWQDFYNIYDLYGEQNSIWDKYSKSVGNAGSTVTLKDMFGMIKNIDMTEVQKSISSIQKGIGYLEDIVKTKETDIPVRKSSYEERPLYRYYDD